ncbi:DUF3889 domain-containing protein [Sporosarcina sp. GW1-11]|uniref:DUF3889 domain-containing protein n=1 Tax=Sporosarcina sp. GW1-11 TaxID=2899126 RepID=UPI00294DD4E5|nr:DUF3889 domain-containing protein [Sporosarcina sp. GW1-11]MDV6377406.1 DUF3889 domain-containing protein [Sporosarcina sp. GW1-11]
MCAIFRKLFIALGILVAGTSTIIEPPVLGKLEVPAYAKWSRLAIKQTMFKYPHADITDYLHIASDSKGELGVEKFRLWLKEESREFGVLVTVTYAAETGKLIRVEFQELN